MVRIAGESVVSAGNAASAPSSKRAERTTSRKVSDKALSLAAELNGAVGFRLRRAVNVADSIFTEIFEPLEITTQHYAILMTIRHNPGCKPSALSALLNITPNNLVPHIDGLVTRGYVARTSSKTDRRIKHLRLTAVGETFCKTLVAKHENVRARVEARMGVENVATLLKMLSLYSDGEDQPAR